MHTVSNVQRILLSVNLILSLSLFTACDEDSDEMNIRELAHLSNTESPAGNTGVDYEYGYAPPQIAPHDEEDSRAGVEHNESATEDDRRKVASSHSDFVPTKNSRREGEILNPEWISELYTADSALDYDRWSQEIGDFDVAIRENISCQLAYNIAASRQAGLSTTANLADCAPVDPAGILYGRRFENRASPTGLAH